MEARARPFGALLRQYRLAAGVSQEELAERARLSAKTISALERGERQRPYRDTIDLLATALGLSQEQRRAMEGTLVRRRVARPGRDELLRGSAHSHTDVEPAVHNLPIEATRLIGRENALDELTPLLAGSRLVTLAGTGGIGKTRLAIELANRAVGRYADGVWFVELAPVEDPELVAASVCALFGLHQAAGLVLSELLVEHLRHKRMLLVLDNCEHVLIKVARLVADLLRSCAGITLLATSREPLRLHGERVWRVPPLSVPEADSAEALSTAGSAMLFCERATGVEPGFSVRPSDIAAIASICRRLDGIPLALELAAARAGVLTPKALARALDDRFPVLTGGDRAASERHQTLRATIEWSYDLLDARERSLFRGVGIFVDGFTLEAAAAVCAGETLPETLIFPTLASLVDKSLVVAELDGESMRYTLLESTLAFAREKLVEAGERDVLARRHAAHIAAFVSARTWEMWTSPDAAVVAEVVPELENLRAALRWSLDEDHDAALGGLLTVRSAAIFRRLDLRVELDERLEAVLRSHRACEDASVEAAANYQLLYSMYVPPERQIAAGERAVELLRASGEKERLAHASALLAQSLAVCFGRYAEARPHIDAALAFARERGDRHLLDQVLRLVSQALPPEALEERRRAGVESIALARASGIGRRIADALITAAEVEFEAGAYAAALDLGREALAAQRGIANRTGLALMLTNVAAYALAATDISSAESAAREALPLAREVDSRLAFAIALQHLASVSLAREGGAERAARLLGFVDSCFAADGFVRETTERLSYERDVATLHAVLGENETHRLLTEGAWLSSEQAVNEALAP